jgi:hypothetical protein
MGQLTCDDKSGKHSDTTFRTWIVFGLVVLYFISIGIQSIFWSGNLHPLQFEILTYLLWFYGIVGGFYLGKRVNEALGSKGKIIAGMLEGTDLGKFKSKKTVESRKL